MPASSRVTWPPRARWPSARGWDFEARFLRQRLTYTYELSRARCATRRDAEPGDIHHSIGNGQVDFADTIGALKAHRY